VTEDADLYQGTLACPVFFEGRGLHTGRFARIAVKPAPANHGLAFEKKLKHGKTANIKADWLNVRQLPLCTCLSDNNGDQVRTVEHLLAACYGAGIDNALIEIDGAEIPLLDGSAKPFVDAITAAGVENQRIQRKTIRITKTVEVTDGARWAKVEPHDGFRVAVQTYFKPYGQLPWWDQEITRKSFATDIAPARTYGLLKEGLIAKFATRLMRDPIGLGANMRNAVCIWRGRVLTPGGLRYHDEFSRHRVLDWIGDLMLAGTDFRAKFTCFSPTHHLAHKVLRAIFDDPASYEALPMPVESAPVYICTR